MNNLQCCIINIIRSALTDTAIELPESFDLAAASAVAKKHGIVAMFYYGAVKCGIDKTDPLMRGLFFQTCRAVSLNEQQMSETEKIFARFDDAGIDYMPLKGTLLKKMYPKGEMRTMGDADILIRAEQYGKIKPVMESLGYIEQAESDHELIWDKAPVHIELHKRLIPSYNKDYYEYFGDGWQLANQEKVGCRYKLSAEDELVYVFTHFAKHYRDAGIGIRHILDIWVYRTCHKELDEEYIKTQLCTLQLYDFYVNVIKTLEVWFENREEDKMTDFITSIVFSSGVYGTHEAQILSEALKEAKSTGSAGRVRAIKLIKKIFLSYKLMCTKYRVLEKVPVLLPIMWVVRWIEALLFKRRNIRTQSRKIQAMSAEKIEGYQQALNYVGLDFNFKE